MLKDRCKSCNAKIEWAKLPGGASCPVQRITKVYQTMGDDTVSALMLYTRFHTPVYVSHFETCPNASKHSKRNQEKGKADEKANTTR